YTVRLVALKDPDRHPPAEIPFGDLAIHSVEFGPKEYLAIALHAHPDVMEDYLRYFYKVRDSIRYAKPRPATIVKAPAALLPPLATRKLILLPSFYPVKLGRSFYPYVRVFNCPQNTLPVASSWPRPNAFLCQPVKFHNP